MALDSKYGNVDIPGIPEDEPIIIFRAQDVFAPFVLYQYKRMVAGACRMEVAQKVQLTIDRFKAWGKKKIPD